MRIPRKLGRLAGLHQPVQLDQWVTRLDNRALLNKDRPDHALLGGLDPLDIASGDDPAGCAGDIVDLCKPKPRQTPPRSQRRS